MARNFKPSQYQWLCNGQEAFAALGAAMDAAQKTIRLEIYIFANDELGRTFRQTLIRACERGVQVRVLIDAGGSLTLVASFWDAFIAAGGEVRWFNPMLKQQFSFRDHRKLLVCDEDTAFIGGFNFTNQYQGDGITSGWFDLGLRVTSPLAVQLAAAFDEMWAHAGPDHTRFKRLKHDSSKRGVTTDDGQLLLTGPARGRNPFARALRKDLAKAESVQIITPYFLPTWRIRRALMRLAREGHKVQLMLPAKNDVMLSKLAASSLYRRLLRAGVEIYEYQPQTLHAKLIIIDGILYTGSSNLDPRSLYINYELMVRLEDKNLVAEAQEIFANGLKHCRQIELDSWHKSRTWWARLKSRWAYCFLVRIDPLIARWDARRKRK